MDGIKVRYWEGRTPPPEYYEPPDPYKPGPKCNINLSELTKYARRTGKRIVDMTYEEVQAFAVQDSMLGDLRDTEEREKGYERYGKET